MLFSGKIVKAMVVSALLGSTSAWGADAAPVREFSLWDRMVRGFRIMRDIMSQPALAGLGGKESPASAQVQSDLQIEQFIRDRADTIYHPVGTCRMGNGPLDVVDAQLRVHGMQGLRVVDASIMPRVVSGNTNAPVIMIAEKAADMIKAAAKLA